MYSAKKQEGAFKNNHKIPTIIQSKNQKLKVVISKSHLNQQTQNFIKTLKNVELISKGSSLKFCMVAEGIAHIYPRLSPTMEWDTAAADAIVQEAGKKVYIYDENFDLNNLQKAKTLKYNKKNLLNPSFIVI